MRLHAQRARHVDAHAVELDGRIAHVLHVRMHMAAPRVRPVHLRAHGKRRHDAHAVLALRVRQRAAAARAVHLQAEHARRRRRTEPERRRVRERQLHARVRRRRRLGAQCGAGLRGLGRERDDERA